MSSQAWRKLPLSWQYYLSNKHRLAFLRTGMQTAKYLTCNRARNIHQGTDGQAPNDLIGGTRECAMLQPGVLGQGHRLISQEKNKPKHNENQGGPIIVAGSPLRVGNESMSASTDSHAAHIARRMDYIQRLHRYSSKGMQTLCNLCIGRMSKRG